MLVLPLISERRESNQHLCQLWRAVELSGDVQDFAGWRNPSPCVAREWDALQPAEAFTAETA